MDFINSVLWKSIDCIINQGVVRNESFESSNEGNSSISDTSIVIFLDIEQYFIFDSSEDVLQIIISNICFFFKSLINLL